ncbi:hypothetical protein K4L06_01410 [Lysobacter sp. BMK333-48F3]|uniref:hypothetical protein n=1 Tax=Lysobacter sp. BMK333-48F3 TaxID=2867962 RepID=UPI001C8C4739|nr:hypothetical protein [Lysobacter sp. BMK333-48F3]MBX9399952.1 hypothetical protein [Lysobacter sp. BMK333-48F3]
MTEPSRLSEWLRALLPALPGAARDDAAADPAAAERDRDGAKPAPVYIAPKRRDGRSDGR